MADAITKLAAPGMGHRGAQNGYQLSLALAIGVRGDW
jgi:hypothetical protein